MIPNTTTPPLNDNDDDDTGVRKPVQHDQAARHRLAGNPPAGGAEDRRARPGGHAVRGAGGRRAARGWLGRPLRRAMGRAGAPGRGAVSHLTLVS